MRAVRNQAGFMSLVVLALVAIILVAIFAVSRSNRLSKVQPTTSPQSFELCVKEGNPVVETTSYPPVQTCKASNGQTYQHKQELKGGIKGRAVISSRQAVCKTGESCSDEPYHSKYTVVVRLAISASRSDTGPMPELVRIEADKNGEFNIQLAQGTYTVEVPSEQSPTAKSQTVEVKDNAYTDVTIHFDLGIR